MENDKKQVTFSFSCLEQESVNLKIRLRYDNLKQKTFFVSLLKMYIDKHPGMIKIVEEIKLSTGAMGKKKTLKATKEIEKGNSILSDLGITDSEKESIFDMIEMSHEEGDYD